MNITITVNTTRADATLPPMAKPILSLNVSVTIATTDVLPNTLAVGIVVGTEVWGKYTDMLTQSYSNVRLCPNSFTVSYKHAMLYFVSSS